jgi:peptidoglycan/LPS O-acetylase OafA/YrhL
MLSVGSILGEVCEGRDNNLNLIRMVAALAVLVSHAWPLTLGPGTVQPLERLLGVPLGFLAVWVFFAVSGFLIARSFERQPTVGRWAMARILRLFPALAVVLVLTVTVLGPLVTELPLAAYLTRTETLTYVPRNLSLAFLQFDLPGVFRDQPYPGAINGSLWTLFHEVACYAGVLVLGLLGILRNRVAMAVLLAGFLLAHHAVLQTGLGDLVPGKLRALMGLALPFAAGVGLYVWRDRVRLHPAGVAALALLAWLGRETPFHPLLLVLALSYGVFVLAHLPGAFLRRYNRLGDYSYGVYIYAFPMQQLMVHLFQPMDPLTNIALAVPATLGLAVLSWTWVEKPALDLNRRLGRRPATTGELPAP